MRNKFSPTFLLILCATLSLGLIASCGKKKASEEGGGKSGGSTCKETTKIEFTVAEEDGHKMESPFEVKKSFAYISGMRYNNQSVAKLGYVVFANYDAELSMYGVLPPKEAGQVALVISFKTKHEDVDFEKQMDVYKGLTIPTGDFKPGWMDPEQIVQVTFFVGGTGSGPTLSMPESTGKASLSVSTPEWLCGEIDFTSPKGSKVKGSFALKVEKDLWVK